MVPQKKESAPYGANSFFATPKRLFYLRASFASMHSVV